MIVVTGASGLVGANLVRALIDQGRPVRALVYHDRRALEGLSVELAQGDVCDKASLERAFTGTEVVYHLAGSISLEMNSWAEVEAINVTGTRNVIEACQRCQVPRLIHFSSIHALQQAPLDAAVDETRPLAALPHLPPYDRSKAAAEKEVRAAIERGLNAVIINPTAMLGPYDFKPSFLGRAVLQLAQGRIPALVKGGFDWVDVRDVVEGAIQAERLAPAGATYLLGGHWHSVQELAEMVASVSGRPAPRFSVPRWLAYQSAPLVSLFSRIRHETPIFTRVTLLALDSNHQVSHARAARELNYQPRPFAETVADTLRWFSAHGYLGDR